MTNMIAQIAKAKHRQIKQEAQENKKLVAKQKNKLKKEQPKEVMPEKVEIIREPQTIMLDIN